MATKLNRYNILAKLLITLVIATWVNKFECCRTSNVEVDDTKLEIELPMRDELVNIAGYGEEKLSTVLIVGTLFCYKDCLTPSWKSRELYPRHISGALVGVICDNEKEENATMTKVITNEYGEFIIDLPSHLHAIPKLDKACLVRILQLPKDSPCYQSSYARKQTKIKIISNEQGIRTYSTGTIAIISKITKFSQPCTTGTRVEDE